MYKNLLVATDGSKLSSKAVAHALGLAQAVGATGKGMLQVVADMDDEGVRLRALEPALRAALEPMRSDRPTSASSPKPPSDSRFR